MRGGAHLAHAGRRSSSERRRLAIFHGDDARLPRVASRRARERSLTLRRGRLDVYRRRRRRRSARGASDAPIPRASPTPRAEEPGDGRRARLAPPSRTIPRERRASDVRRRRGPVGDAGADAQSAGGAERRRRDDRGCEEIQSRELSAAIGGWDFRARHAAKSPGREPCSSRPVAAALGKRPPRVRQLPRGGNFAFSASMEHKAARRRARPPRLLAPAVRRAAAAAAAAPRFSGTAPRRRCLAHRPHRARRRRRCDGDLALVRGDNPVALDGADFARLTRRQPATALVGPQPATPTRSCGGRRASRPTGVSARSARTRRTASSCDDPRAALARLVETAHGCASAASLRRIAARGWTVRGGKRRPPRAALERGERVVKARSVRGPPRPTLRMLDDAIPPPRGLEVLRRASRARRRGSPPGEWRSRRAERARRRESRGRPNREASRLRCRDPPRGRGRRATTASSDAPSASDPETAAAPGTPSETRGTSPRASASRAARGGGGLGATPRSDDRRVARCRR